MARRKTGWTRRLDAKRLAFAGLNGMLSGWPAARRALSFYPGLSGLPDRVDSIADDRVYRVRLAEPRFRPALAALAPHDWDVRRPEIVLRDDFAVRVFAGIVRDVVVPGHTLTPVDPGSARQIAFAFEGNTNWNFARPGFPRLRVSRLVEPALVLPAHFNYWHLLVEHLLPLVHAWTLRAWGDGPLTLLTRAKRPPLIDAVAEGLRREGADIRVRPVSPWETVRLDRMLVAATHCHNAEHSYALPDAIPAARRVFAAAYRDRPARPWGPRVYVTRRGARLRRIGNEDEIVAGLEARGFEILAPDWSNHPDQIAAFTGASIVVGPHGAGLTNLVFARPGTAVVELFPFDHRKSPMLHLCAEHDLSHGAVFGSPEGSLQGFTVDAAAVFDRVDALLSRPDRPHAPPRPA